MKSKFFIDSMKVAIVKSVQMSLKNQNLVHICLREIFLCCYREEKQTWKYNSMITEMMKSFLLPQIHVEIFFYKSTCKCILVKTKTWAHFLNFLTWKAYILSIVFPLHGNALFALSIRSSGMFICTSQYGETLFTHFSDYQLP